MPNAWFRFYSEVLGDRKLYRVAVELEMDRATVIGVWAGVLCLANDSPERGRLLVAPGEPLTMAEIAGAVGTTVSVLERVLAAFGRLGMVSLADDLVEVLHWDERQFESDASAGRVARYRDRRQQSGMPRTMKLDTRAVLARDGDHCIYCGSNENLCVDHLIPVRQGGTDDMGNLAAACRRCNSGKAGRRPEEAGYQIVTSEARERYARALAGLGVTGVTVTPPAGCNLPESESESESESEAEGEEEATAPPPPPARPRTPPPPPPPPPPAAEAYRELRGRYPRRETFPLLAERVGDDAADVQTFKRAVSLWAGAKYHLDNINGILDWFDDLKAGRNPCPRPARGRDSPRNGAAADGRADESLEDAAKRLGYTR